MRSSYLILLFSIVATLSYAQFNLSLETGYGSYYMKDLKQLQSSVVLQSNVNLKSVSNFPSYFNYSVNIGYSVNNQTTVGIAFRYASTGARSDYSDYSGSARLDQLLNSYLIGSYINRKLNKSNVWPILLCLNVNTIRTNVNVSSYLNVNGLGANNESFSMKGIGVGAMGSFILQRSLGKNLYLFARGGYEAFVNSKLKLNGGTANFEAQWGGFRFGFGVGALISKKELVKN